MINIIGGTYREVNIECGTNDIIGSGLRASHFFLENASVQINYYTYGESLIKKRLLYFTNIYKNFNFTLNKTEKLITFKYYFSLDTPEVIPDRSSYVNKSEINTKDDCDSLCFGIIEGDFSINGKKVVYDPQNTITPVKFTEKNKAEKLIYILNRSEASSISNANHLPEILDFFFDEEKCFALVIKNGAYGATLFLDKNTKKHIPVYKTGNVNKIGSGDIFSSAFAYYWFTKDYDIEKCALNASKCTAIYCNSNILNIQCIDLDKIEFQELFLENLNAKQVYIASPIFKLSEIILIDKIRNIFIDFGIKVFSPYHDIGYGNEIEIAKMDIDGINKSDIIFSIIDGLDSGTLIELGYSMANNKKIIAYNRTECEGDILMLKPSNIKIFNDLTTAIYNTIWEI